MITPSAAPPDGVPPTPGAGTDLRSRTRRALQAEITAIAFDLFDRQGFEATTINQIAAAAGLSRSSFFRYFATKEDVVLLGVEERGLVLRDALAARPPDETPWQALRRALEVIVRLNSENPDRVLRLSRMMVETPSLQARQMQREDTWARLLAPEIARRLGLSPQDTTDPRPGALASAALGCFHASMRVWRESGGKADLAALLDQAMSALST
ncbi:Transcriptional regulator [Frankia canadensis]|uniref:Transcriptional regulator n=1 Tax=Frankia canadensis TaxID=1836972 RepID=A0A2I2KXI9_9ACTN|nr:TetR/AcrR family transcriptional regulator [Frankia canadensis]SNQ50377.1 Transcriptional regulator [Frankia canadensis]SOU57667.1 Transcriptional regulator [Frankia canadensis]